MNKSTENIEAYMTDDALEKYSNYALFPNERLLFDKYFRKGSSVLDLACGAGRTTLRLYELGYKVKGVDLSTKLIKAACQRFEYINFEIGDYSDIKEDDTSFDNILISHNGLDHAYPETVRIKAISECFRVLRPGGYLIFSGHNIKSLYLSPYYYLKQRKLWFLKNTWQAYKKREYLYDLNSWMFYCSPSYCKQQVISAGFKFIDMVGFRGSRNDLFNKFISPYNHFVFQKSK